MVSFQFALYYVFISLLLFSVGFLYANAAKPDILDIQHIDVQII